MYPNPANNHIYITGAEIKEVKIYNMMGMLMNEQLVNASSECKINIGNLSNGIYTIQIKTITDNIVVKKFVKQ